MKTVLITGVCGGIGAATATLFLNKGWRVIGVDRMSTSRAGLCSEYYQVDLAQESQVADLFERLSEVAEGLDALVNSAGIQLCKSLVETSLDEWDALMAINLRAIFLMMKYAHPMLRLHQGSIVNVGSVHAKVTSPKLSVYAASKGGLEALSRAAALEFAPDKIRVNGVHPGAVDTEMLAAGLHRGHLKEGSENRLMDQLGKKHPLGRVGRPEEIAETIMFLADSSRSSFVTGAFLVVDGGTLARLCTE